MNSNGMIVRKNDFAKTGFERGDTVTIWNTDKAGIYRVKMVGTHTLTCGKIRWYHRAWKAIQYWYYRKWTARKIKQAFPKRQA